MLRALAVAFALASCSPYGGGAFSCTQDTQCGAGGTCSAGFCAFTDENCPSRLRYGDSSGPNSGMCVGQQGMGDAPPAGSDAMTGSDSGSQMACYGAGPGKVCFAQAPTGTQMLNAAIDTDTAACATNVIGTSPGCVLAGDTVMVTGTVAVTGSKPLVLVAATTLTIAGTLDASSHRAGGGQIGAGADPATCNAGTVPGTRGGGAGGSFGTQGGNGGNNNGGNGAGIAGAAQATLTTLRGGCPGQTGNTGGGTAGTAGHGGGAVYLIAGATLLVTSGSINASGQPGGGAMPSSAGGGGGGAGGLIVFDAPSVTNNASVFANGGGGGEGASGNTNGNTGADPTANSAPGGTGGSGPGGDGGKGAFAANAATNGANGTGNGTGGGGGGGGGGAGLIKLYQATTIGGNGTVSPPPS